LWGNNEIDTTGWNQPEEIAYLADGLKVIRNVVQPSLTAYLPDPAFANGTPSSWLPAEPTTSWPFEHEGIQVAGLAQRPRHRRLHAFIPPGADRQRFSPGRR